MDKRILIGAGVGLVLGLIEMFLFTQGNGGILWLIMGVVAGAAIGFASTRPFGINFLVLSFLIGLVLYLVVAANTGQYLDDILTGGITGLLIGLGVKYMARTEVA
ncbi:hypothetical protein [Flavilitoribacter nigricans]|uniref:Uncharacterized protein n=1 Tax=Flavilitoribacter nigricans (strain ATCC 23147 / DSM 23189 / NBRC 102662 / NCIMB 1420 / SS-2) TaxID=1122177 RepID=A0A2D0N1N7_FLAN2|nr:hypothetical protein [Flavilitoribacter nigricans]PHN02462.1 hypothetical protein CRP01_32285 [Flavilitoribacter nigricans DSM 23189 = NBRC 102662]